MVVVYFMRLSIIKKQKTLLEKAISRIKTFVSRHVKGQEWNEPNLTKTKKQRTIRIMTAFFSLLTRFAF